MVLIFNIKLPTLVLQDLLEVLVRRLIVELKNTWPHKLSAIHIMVFQLIYGHLVFFFILCFLLNTLLKVIYYLFRS